MGRTGGPRGPIGTKSAMDAGRSAQGAAARDSVVDGAIAFRTDPGTATTQACGCRVAFEVDRIDDASSAGWSVLVRGYARAVTEPAGCEVLGH